jgi:NAD(P)-dependent dehydrogenase (short-subunit alcohol dehydrogenase family)
VWRQFLLLLDGKAAIVLGVGPGLGEALALQFAAHGASVVVASRSGERLATVVKRIEHLGARAVAVETDITDMEQCARLAAATAETFGRIDVLVNNAVRYGSNQRIENAQPDQWRAVFEVNVLGAMNACRAVIPAMRAQGSGSILFVSTQLIRQFNPGLRPQGDYASSKGALHVAARHLAGEVGPYGIRVNTIVPGYIWGPRLQARLEREAAERGVDSRELYDGIAGRLAMRAIPTSDQVARAAVFFASDLSQAVTGQSLDVNGGEYMD